MAEISVIVPVYKAEDFLASCLNSILSQSFSDFELILVDDGSPDHCGEICEEYAAGDSRITVLHQENQGQAAARNHALAVAKAPWVCFVDSDDLIHPQMLELLYRAAEAHGAAISQCRMLEAPELPENFFDPVEAETSVYTMDDETLAGLFDGDCYPAWVSCAKLIRRELVEAYPFHPGRVFEDNEAVCRWVVAAGKLAEVPLDLYFYRTNLGSTTKSSLSLKKLDFLWALESILNFYREAGFRRMYERFFDLFVMESAGYCRGFRERMGMPDVAKSVQKNFRRCMGEQKRPLTKLQREEVLDAMHPKLIRFYWPIEGATRTLREEGLAGAVRKLKKHLGGDKQ